jgi:hypothetical protein
MKKVDIVIGGMQKGGTTSLARYIESHKQVNSHPQMEMTYFYDSEEYQKGWNVAVDNYFFDCDFSDSDKLLLVKYAALIRSSIALKRLVDHNSKVKLLIILRNPVDRAWSSFLMEVGNGEPTYTFEQAAKKVLQNKTIDQQDWRQNIYFGLGQYSKFLKQVYALLPASQVKVVFLEELQQSPQVVMQDIFVWLGLSPGDYNFSLSEKKVNSYAAPRSKLFTALLKKVLNNKNPLKAGLKKILSPRLQHAFGEKLRKLNKKPAAAPKLSPDLRSQLNEFYLPYNAELSELLNKDLAFWK